VSQKLQSDLTLAQAEKTGPRSQAWRGNVRFAHAEQLLAQFRTASKQAQSEKAEAEAKVAETSARLSEAEQSLARLRADSRQVQTEVSRSKPS